MGEVVRHEGELHNGLSHVIQFVGQKPEWKSFCIMNKNKHRGSQLRSLNTYLWIHVMR